MTAQSHNRVLDAGEAASVTGGGVTLMGETYYRILNYDMMPPFFMTVVSSDDHWLFVATTGGLTAGRVNADHALFPYYTEDRIEENANNTGPKTIIQVNTQVWEPFVQYSPYKHERNLYKNIAGTALVFEEVNVELGLTFRYAWRTSNTFGIVRTAWIVNQSKDTISVSVTDGLQNILPAHIAAGTQNEFSVLLDAYKRNELDLKTGLGIFSLSSRLTDLAEPSEALRANTVWQVGLDPEAYLLSSSQIGSIRAGYSPNPETVIRGRRGAYFAHASFEMAPDTERSWHLVAEVDQDGAAVSDLVQQLSADDLYTTVERDIVASGEQLKRIVAGADGIQVSGDPLSTEHHFTNVLFNVMRGGTFADQYWIKKADFLAYVDTHYRGLRKNHTDFFAALPEAFIVQTLKDHADGQDNPNLIRLSYTYLPLTFSRRHGDPSRPWNWFSIHLKNADGSPQLSYEGNWRDIFQNWEALVYAYPEFIEGMIAVFLNATTIDGYNPYRITRDGIDWEVPEPSNPWANIGYWSDHQIIYLQKLMEAYEAFYPGKLRSLLTRPIFAYANVPYRIKPYDDIVRDPYNTIDFDWDAEHAIAAFVQERGTDGRLLLDSQGKVFHVTLAEKLLNLLLAKLVNFVPDGGIWMNTQRPEWNDANNALVGKGLSVVTACYLRRFVVFFQLLLEDMQGDVTLSQELYTLFQAVHSALDMSHSTLTAEQRRTIIDALGTAGSAYRQTCYNGYSGDYVHVSSDKIRLFLTLARQVISQTIRANRREDSLYHAYNILHLNDGGAEVQHLYLMLEGQVAVLSSGLLEPEAVLALLHQLRQSALYREDQHSYILYPDRDLPGFMQKNTFDEAEVRDLKLVQALVERDDPRLIIKDTSGRYHFGGDLRNARDVSATLKILAERPEYANLVATESDAVLALFERIFNHDSFTGRSGSFFGYEGLGSIYWHMVSKLLLSVQENVYRAQKLESDALTALIDAYYDIRAGLGFNKSPAVYGAFPLDPYSHTPRDQGAKQPGMTGMVKEEILTRMGELGIAIEDGEIVFNPVLLRPVERLESPSTLRYWDTDNQEQQVRVPTGAYAFTLCRVPVVVQQANQNQFTVHLHDGTQKTIPGSRLDTTLTGHIFAHDGVVRQITISYQPESLQ
jgi:hypothetical protein